MLEPILLVLCMAYTPPAILTTVLLWHKIAEARLANSRKAEDGRLDGLPPSAFIDHGIHGERY